LPVRLGGGLSKRSGAVGMMGRFGKLLVLLVIVAYPILLHVFILKDELEAWRLLFVFAPLLLVASWVIFRSIAKIWWPFAALALCGLIWYVVTGEHGKFGLMVVNGLWHATLNLFFLWFFGRTLLPGREPLIAQVSRRVNGTLNPEVVDYTRHVTIAWCWYFGGQVAVSLLLYVFAPLAAWSFFINVLNLPLLALMFIGEHTYRTARFPNHHRTPILKAIEVFTKDFAAPKKADNER
jgi:uncharacterized membrane protein